MDEFKQKIEEFKKRVESYKGNLKTEEATKTTLIMPFLQALGYDVFNPLEVIPEYIPDKGFKKDERVDYAILKDNKPVILVECKRVENEKLDIKKFGNQLFKYFVASKAKFIIFTNGIVYKFFTDAEDVNVLDKEPFFVFNINSYKESDLQILEGFCKSNFDIEKAASSAGDLKYIRSFAEVMENEYTKPSDDFVKYLLDKSSLYEGIKTAKIIDKHKKTAVEAFNLFMSKVMKTSLDFNLKAKPEENKNEIVTTFEEIEGYAIVKCLLYGVVDLKRIFWRDNASYFNILLDDSILKTICRLYLNHKSIKYVAFLSPKTDGKGNIEEKIQINSLYDLFNMKERIINRVKELDKK